MVLTGLQADCRLGTYRIRTGGRITRLLYVITTRPTMSVCKVIDNFAKFKTFYQLICASEAHSDTKRALFASWSYFIRIFRNEVLP